MKEKEVAEPYIYILGEDGVLHASPAFLHFPPKWVPHTRWQRFKKMLWGFFGREYYEYECEYEL